MTDHLSIPAVVFAVSSVQTETALSDDPVIPFSAVSGCPLLLPFLLESHWMVPQLRKLVQESKKISLLPNWVYKLLDELLTHYCCSRSQKSGKKNIKREIKTKHF